MCKGTLVRARVHGQGHMGKGTWTRELDEGTWARAHGQGHIGKVTWVKMQWQGRMGKDTWTMPLDERTWTKVYGKGHVDNGPSANAVDKHGHLGKGVWASAHGYWSRAHRKEPRARAQG